MDQVRAIDPLGGGWVLLLLLVAVGILGWINIVSPKKWGLIVRSFFSFRLGRQTLRDELDLQDRTLIALLAMAAMLTALFVYQLAVLAGAVAPQFMVWVRFFAYAGALLLAQVVILRLVGWLFASSDALDEYLFTLLLFHVMLGIALLPVCGLLAYPHSLEWRTWLAWSGAGIAAGTVVFRWLRAAVVGIGGGIPLRYIFVYLCALEILPVALASQHLLRVVHPASLNQ